MPRTTFLAENIPAAALFFAALSSELQPPGGIHRRKNGFPAPMGIGTDLDIRSPKMNAYMGIGFAGAPEVKLGSTLQHSVVLKNRCKL